MQTIRVLPRDGGGRLLALVVAVMAYLAALSIGAGWLVSNAVEGWTGSVTHRLTVQIPPHGDVAAALKLLRGTSGVLSADALDDAALGRLLSPWLGASVDLKALPVPRLIDVTVDQNAETASAALGAALAKAVPGASLDDHRAWLADILHLSGLARNLCWAVAALISCATVAIVVFAARAGLTQHRDVVEVLHLIGARDQSIAGAFERQVLKISLTGGAFGAIAAALTLYVLGQAAFEIGDPLLMALKPGLAAYLILLPVPLVLAALAIVTARITVLRLLDAVP